MKIQQFEYAMFTHLRAKFAPSSSKYHGGCKMLGGALLFSSSLKPPFGTAGIGENFVEIYIINMAGGGGVSICINILPCPAMGLYSALEFCRTHDNSVL